MTGFFTRISLIVWCAALSGVINSGFLLPSAQADVVQELQAQVWAVDILGNESYSDLVLKGRIATESPTFLEKLKFWDRTGHELNETEIRKDVIRLQNYYQRRGYNNVGVQYEIQTLNKTWKKRVIFTIDENPPIRIEKVNYNFLADRTTGEYIREHAVFDKAELNHAYREGRRYEKIREPEVIGRFTDALKNMGFAFAEVHVSAKVDTALLSAEVTIQCNPGPMTYIDEIQVEGSSRVPDRYIIREAGLSIGHRYNLDDLQDAQQELFNHHLFRFATISIPEQQPDSSLVLLIRIRENELRSVEASIGFGTEEKVRGQLSWSHRNVLLRGHRFTATARASFIEQTASTDYLIPYIFNPKSSVVISPFLQHLLESNFELFRGGLTNSFIYRYSRDLTASASYQFTKNLELSKQLNTSLPDTTREYDLSSFQVNGYYSQGFSQQGEGWVIQPYGELSGFFGLAAFNFQKASIDVRRFTRLSSSTILATRIQMGGLFSANTDSLPNNIRFYLGGTNSVRGWYRHQLGPKQALIENGTFVQYVPLGGRALLGFNAEIRQDLDTFIKGFGVAFFLDGGQIWRSVSSANLSRLRFGAGGGLRYRSPIGPMRIDIGYKLNPSDQDLNVYRGTDYGGRWERIGIHFSIGQAF